MMKSIIHPRFLVIGFLLISFNRVYADPLTSATFGMEEYRNNSEPEIIENYNQGEKSFGLGQYREALDHYVKNIAFGETIEFLGNDYFDASSTGYPTSDRENAEGYYAFYDSMYKLGCCYLILEEYEQAITYYEIMTGRFTLFDYGFYNLARSYSNLGDDINTIKVLRKLISNYISISGKYYVSARAYKWLEKALFSEEKNSEVIESGIAASKINDPERVYPVFIASLAAAKTGNDEIAVTLLAEGISSIQSEKMESLLEDDWIQKELHILLEKGEINPILGNFMTWAIACHTNSEIDKDEAFLYLDSNAVESELEELINNIAYDPYAYYMLAKYCAQRGNPEKAFSYLLMATNDSPAIADALITKMEGLTILRNFIPGKFPEDQPIDNTPDYERLMEAGSLRMVVQNGHALEVTNLAISPDEHLIATTSGDRTVMIWSINGILLNTLSGADRGTTTVAFSPSGNHVAAGDNGGALHLWDINGECQWSMGGGYPIGELTFSPDGRFIAVGKEARGDTASYEINVYTLEGTLYDTYYGHTRPIAGLSFSQDSQNLVSSSDDGTVKIWNSFHGGQVGSFRISEEFDPKTIIFDIDESLIINVAGSIGRYDINGILLETLINDIEPSDIVCISPDLGIDILRMKNPPRLFDRIQTLCTYSNYDGNGNPGLSFSVESLPVEGYTSSENLLASVDSDGFIRVFRREGELQSLFKARGDWILDVAMTPDGSGFVATHENRTTTIQRLDGYLEHTIIGDELENLDSVDIDSNGTILISSHRIERDHDRYKLIRIYEKPYSTAKKFQWPPPSLDSMIGSEETGREPRHETSFSADSQFLLDSEFGMIDISSGYRINSPSFSASLSLYGKAIWAESLRENRSTVVTTSVSQGRKIFNFFTLEGQPVSDFSFPEKWELIARSGDGKLFAFCEPKEEQTYLEKNLVYLVNTRGEIVKTIPLPEEKVLSYTASFLPDGSTLMMAIKNGGYGKAQHIPIRRYDFNGLMLSEHEGHLDGVRSIRFDDSGKYMVSYGRDNIIKVHNLENGEHINVVTDGTNWIAYCEDGVFTASSNGGHLVAIVKGLTPFAIDQFALRTNRPDVLLSRMQLGEERLIDHYQSLYAKRAYRLGLSPDVRELDYNVPQSSIISVSNNGKQSEIAMQFEDLRYPLSSYNIYVNDVPLYGFRGKALVGQSAVIQESIELSTGNNKIEVVCRNNQGIESFRTLTSTVCNVQTEPDLYFIGFGVSEYLDEDLNLEYAAKDAGDLAATFATMKERDGIREVYVRLFLNQDATRSNLAEAKEILQKTKVDDIVVLFISGHGIHDEDPEATYYYLTHETDLDNIPQTCAPFSEIEELLQGIPARQKLFLMDTCESGEFLPELEGYEYDEYGGNLVSRGRVKMNQRGISNGSDSYPARIYLLEQDRYIYNDLVRRSGAVVFSSCGGGEYSYESPEIENGYFSEYVMDGLDMENTDTNEDGLISTDELRSFVINGVSSATDGWQNPTVDRDNISIEFGFPVQ